LLTTLPIDHVVDQRLHQGFRVTINLPPSDARARLRDFDATVVRLLDAAVVLEPDIDFELIPGQTDGVFLSFVHGRGLVALKGSLTRDGGGVRFRVADGVRVRRERAPRVDVELPVTLRRGTEEVAGTTANISRDGLLVRTALRAGLEDQIELTLEQLRFTALVVRHGDGMVALQLVDGPRDALDRLVGSLT
jgi:hypothetical protein